MELVIELNRQKKAFDLVSYRRLTAVRAGNYEMSVQGSDGHYCSPRSSEFIDNYLSMELALFTDEGWLNIYKSNVLKQFKRYNELISFIDDIDSECPVFGYVPVELLNDLYIYLKDL